MERKLVITIEGPSGAGKSTLSKLLAGKLNYTYIDSGALYRAVALKVQQTGADADDDEALSRLCANLAVSFHQERDGLTVMLDGADVTEAIRAPEISMLASRVSARKTVRDALLGVQRKLGEEGGIVVEGRDTYRVICDHVRSAAFLIADGVVPGNAGRNYVARMIIRRAARFAPRFGLNEPFLAKVAQAVIDEYGDFYPELTKAQPAILDNLTREEVRFARTVEAGTAQLENLFSEIRAANKTVLDGHKAFDLYATYGLPFEISRDIAREQRLDVDEAGFTAAKEEHAKASGGGKAMGKLGGEDAEYFAGILKDLQAKKKLGKDGVRFLFLGLDRTR